MKFQKQTKYTVQAEDLVVKPNSEVKAIALGKKIFKIKDYVNVSRYPDWHAYKGQVRSVFINEMALFEDIFGRPCCIGSAARDDQNQSDICAADLVMGFLFQVKHACETEACTHPMGQWISFDVSDTENFEKDLNELLKTIERMVFTYA